MRFFQTLAAGAALVASALALTIDTFPSSVEAGKTYTITYSPKDNTPTTFILRKGLSTNLDTVDTLTTTATGGTFQWTVDSKYVDASNYALEIRQQGANPNFSGQFPLTGGEGTESSSSSSGSASATASSTGSVTRSASASISASPSASANGTTVSSATISRTSGTSRPTSTSGGVPQATTNAAAPLAPVAAFAGLFAAFAYLA